ncbi:SAV_6107 family HEPN domain-containing protein [Cellulomonas sp. 179-A 4D5 NHS]|uniref:SAV_6107 family HEPN domain-containing protein n=1 Tax=Cellulomonas sp. 179-A 4D5 NHS TaxID=3142378 RepID=UPI0039A374DE
MAHEHRAVSAGLPPRAASLVQRAEAELVAAQFSPEPWERFSHAHLAALRAGAAVVAERGKPGGRRAPRTVWEMLDAVAPELSRWSGYFAGGAGLRAAIEAGRFETVSAERAEQVLCAAEDFLDEVRSLLEASADHLAPVPERPRLVAARAS